MAKGDFTRRIKFEGGAEAKQLLLDLGNAGENLGKKLGSGLGDANPKLKDFESGTKTATVSSGALKNALTNLSFQVNDVATSLGSGGDPMRVFAQQAGQIFQAFQQGGGLSAVLGAAARGVANFITPLRAGIGVLVAFAAAVAFIAKQAADSESRTRKFDVQLKALGKGTRVTGKDLEAAAERLRDVGLTAEEAGQKISKGLAEGVNPNDIEKVVRAGANLNAVLGDGAIDEFIAAAGKGGEPLRAFAEKLGIVPPKADDMSDSLKKSAEAAKKFGEEINNAFEKRAQSIGDEKRRLTQEIADLTRKKGTAEEEAMLQSQRRITEINRDTSRQINEIIKQRNKEAQQQLQEFNDKVEKSAQEAADNRGIIDAITGKVNTSLRDTLGPAAKAIFDLRVAWSKLVTDLSKSEVFTGIVSGIAKVVEFVAKLIADKSGIPAVALAIVALLPVLLALKAAFAAITLVMSPWLLIIGAVIVAIVLIATNWETIVKKLGDGWEAVKTFFQNGIAAIVKFISDLPGVIGGFLADFFKPVTDGLQTVIDFFKNLFEKSMKFISDWATFLMDKATAAVAWIEDQINGLVDWFAGGWDKIKEAFAALTEWIKTKIDDWLGWFGGLLDKAAKVATAIRNAIGGNKQLDEAGQQAGVTAATGGRVWGPGTATSDSILSWLSNGEFVVNALATRKWLPLLHAINRGLMPKVKMAAGGAVTPKMGIPRFALGGFSSVGAFGGSLRLADLRFGDFGNRGSVVSRRPVNIQIGNQTLEGLEAPEDQMQKIINKARQMLGRRISNKPGWYGG